MGGTFTSMNKIRPDTYINFVAVPQQSDGLSNRGVVTFATNLDWGASNTLIELYSTDLTDGSSFSKVGLTAYSGSASQIFREALRGCAKALVWRLNGNGIQATATDKSGLSATALYSGVLGNSIAITSTQKGTTNVFDISTVVNGEVMDTQTIATYDQLVSNDWVTFSSDIGKAAKSIAGMQLSGGVNGTPTVGSSGTIFTPYFTALQSNTQWNTLAALDVTATDTSISNEAAALVTYMRETKGIKVQAVVLNFPQANYEGIISISQGYTTDSESIQPTIFAATIAGLTAGAEPNQSLTNYVIPSATGIINPMTDDQINTALANGQMVIAQRQDGQIAIVQDINTLYLVPTNKNSDWQKNRIIRTLDDIATFCQITGIQRYIGMISNDDTGRNLLKSEIIAHLNQLVAIECIQSFDSSKDIVISQGDEINDVVIQLWIQPIDAVEKIYITVNVT
ncbi:MAG: phage tail sheath family protein [Bacillota bacterium]|nr:phage tail sheath family protein [Bacillota bacterium]